MEKKPTKKKKKPEVEASFAFEALIDLAAERNKEWK